MNLISHPLEQFRELHSSSTNYVHREKRRITTTTTMMTTTTTVATRIFRYYSVSRIFALIENMHNFHILLSFFTVFYTHSNAYLVVCLCVLTLCVCVDECTHSDYCYFTQVYRIPKPIHTHSPMQMQINNKFITELLRYNVNKINAIPNNMHFS